ncbi:MAG: hypothetical protein IPM76_24165 [Chloroflexi bacterium]|nr:hypothetical protein [Chloroflexota bacterium]
MEQLTAVCQNTGVRSGALICASRIRLSPMRIYGRFTDRNRQDHGHGPHVSVPDEDLRPF